MGLGGAGRELKVQADFHQIPSTLKGLHYVCFWYILWFQCITYWWRFIVIVVTSLTLHYLQWSLDTRLGSRTGVAHRRQLGNRGCYDCARHTGCSGAGGISPEPHSDILNTQSPLGSPQPKIQVVAAADHSQTLLASVLRVMLHALNTNQVPTVYIFESNQTPFTVNQLSSTPVCCPAISCFKVGLTIVSYNEIESQW